MAQNLLDRWRRLWAVPRVGAVAATLDMEADEIQRRAVPAGIVILAIGAVVEKRVQERCRSPAWRWVGRGRPADACLGAGRFHRRSGVVVELVELFERALPVVIQVRLVPQFPVPRR